MLSKMKLVVIIAVLLLPALLRSDTIYQSVNERGQTVFSDQQLSKNQLEKTHKYDIQEAPADVERMRAREAEATQENTKMWDYVTDRKSLRRELHASHLELAQAEAALSRGEDALGACLYEYDIRRYRAPIDAGLEYICEAFPLTPLTTEVSRANARIKYLRQELGM